MQQTEEKEVQGKSNRGFLGALTFSHISQHFYFGAPIVFSHVRLGLGLSYGDIGLVNGASNILGGFLQIVYIIAARRYSRRILLGMSFFAMTLGCLLIGFANGFSVLFTGNAIAGAGQAGTHPLSISIIADKFEKKKVASALSTFYGIGYLGNIISPLLLGFVAVAIPQGWRFSFFLVALMPLIAGLIVILYLRGEPAGDRIVLKGTQDSLLNSIKSSLKIKSAAYILLAQSFIAGGTTMVIVTTWVPLFLQTKQFGLDLFQTSIIGAISVAGGVLGTIIIGRYADKFGHLQTAIATILSTVILVFLLTLYPSFTPIIIVHLFLIGATTFSIPSILQAHLSIIATPSQRDILLGLFFTVSFGISSIWSTVLGNVIDIYNFNAAWTGMSLLGIIALIALFVAYRNTPRKARALVS
ncbi:MFS transporter [Candidatus Bathyarchaeota archaeon]|nr:MFS transporter [Candidatus Bathyarchaeota archaeon]